MHNIYSIVLIIFSCNKHKDSGAFYGNASAIINSVSWKTDKVRCRILADNSCYRNKLFVECTNYSKEGNLRGVYSIIKFVPDVSLQKVYPENFNNICNDTLDATYTTVTEDGDVAGELFNAVPGENYLHIEKYNSATKEIRGSFTITYAIFSRPASVPATVDTIRVTNGKFYTKISN